MSKYFDVPVTLDVVIAIEANGEEEAHDILSKLTEKEMLELLVEQVSFVSTAFDNMTTH